MALSKTGRKVLTDLAGGKWSLWHQPLWDHAERYEMHALTKRYGVHPAVVKSLLTAGYIVKRGPNLAEFIITRAGIDALEEE